MEVVRIAFSISTVRSQGIILILIYLLNCYLTGAITFLLITLGAHGGTIAEWRILGIFLEILYAVLGAHIVELFTVLQASSKRRVKLLTCKVIELIFVVSFFIQTSFWGTTLVTGFFVLSGLYVVTTAFSLLLDDRKEVVHPSTMRKLANVLLVIITIVIGTFFLYIQEEVLNLPLLYGLYK